MLGEDADRLIAYNRMLDLARHFGFRPKACRPYRPKTKGKVERPFRYIGEDFFLARSFRNLDADQLARDAAEVAEFARVRANPDGRP